MLAQTPGKVVGLGIQKIDHPILALDTFTNSK